MRLRAIEAVWAYRVNSSNFRAIYGRFPGSTTYTKDYLQTSGDCRNVLNAVLGRTPGTNHDIEFRWPGGQRVGGVYDAPDRVELAWRPSGVPPDSWKVNPDPAGNPPATLLGTPDLPTEADAENERITFEGQDFDAWLIAVKLWGEPDVLHTRAFLGNPPPDMAHASTDALPQKVLEAIATLPPNRACTVVRFPELPGVRAEALVRDVLGHVRAGANVLLSGPPGTSKTVVLEDLRSLYEEQDDWILFDPDLLHNCFITVEDRRARAAVFHSSYSYEEFVLGLLPEPVHGGGVQLVPRPGPLVSLGHWASEPGNASLLTVDEFNRGNTAAIFGDMLALLDAGKRSDASRGVQGAAIDRAYASLPVQVHPDFATPTQAVADPLRLPAALGLVAALNTSDRSVTPMDAALRRRFAIIDVPPDLEVLADHYGVAVPPEAYTPPPPATNWTVDDVKYLAIALIRSLNKRIEYTVGRDFLLGHALVWNVDGPDLDTAAAELCQAVDEYIVASLRVTFAHQDEFLAAILRAPVIPASPGAGANPSLAYWVLPPAELESVSAPRLRTVGLQGRPWDEASQMLADLL